MGVTDGYVPLVRRIRRRPLSQFPRSIECNPGSIRAHANEPLTAEFQPVNQLLTRRPCPVWGLHYVQVVDVELVVPLPTEGFVERLCIKVGLRSGERQAQLPIVARALGRRL